MRDQEAKSDAAPKPDSPPDIEKSAQWRRVLPDPNICRTSIIGAFKPFPACLVENPAPCPYAFATGEVCHCTHPGGRAFIKR